MISVAAAAASPHLSSDMRCLCFTAEAAETSINQETYYTDKLYKSETVLWWMEEMTRVVEIW